MNIYSFFKKGNSMVPLIGGKPGEVNLNTPEYIEIFEKIRMVIKDEKTSVSINILSCMIASLVVHGLPEKSRSSSIKNIFLNIRRLIPALHDRYFWSLLRQLKNLSSESEISNLDNEC